MKKEVNVSRDNGDVCNEKNDENAELLWVLFIRFYEKMAMTVRSTSLVVYNVYDILLNVSTRTNKRLIDNKYTVVGFLRGCCTQEQLGKEESVQDQKVSRYVYISSIKVPLVSGVQLTAVPVGRTTQLIVLYEAMKVEVGPP